MPLIRRSDLSNLKECLGTEINVNNEKCFFTFLYRSPSQSHEELESFCSSLDSLLSNRNDQHPTCSIVIGDFNATCSKWYSSDKDNTAGLELDSITTQQVIVKWLINQPTHFINKSSSCIDFIFSSKTSFVKNCGSELMDLWKMSSWYHKTLNFDIPLPSPYFRDIWDYRHENTESIQKAISTFDWS